MLETKSQARRRVRDAKIIELWCLRYDRGQHKGKHTLIAEGIADECNTSLSTVNRIINTNNLK